MQQNEKTCLTAFFIAIAGDPRISVTHIGVFAALCRYWELHNYANPVKAYSYEVMPLAKLSSPNTYHKCVRDLSEFGYIRYEPSYKKNQGSKIFFLGQYEP